MTASPYAVGPLPNSSVPMRRLLSAPWLFTLLLAIVVVVVGKVGPDWPAQEFRAYLARHDGLTAWDDQWYGGHALPGYSLLFPPVAAALGAAVSGLLGAVGSSWLVSRLLPPIDRGRLLFGLAFAVTVVGNLFLGQVPFLLGLLFGLAALLAAQRLEGRGRLWVLLLAVVSSFCSPLSGLFLLLAGVAWAFDVGWRRALPLAGAVAGSGVSVLTGGGSGPICS